MGHIDLSEHNFLGVTLDNGRLRLVQVLGSGASGVVYLAVEQSLNVNLTKTYAVKCIPKAEPGSHHIFLQRREIRHHYRMSSHPNVLTLHKIMEDDSYIFLVLDFCSGGDLFKLITEGGRFCGDDYMVKKVFLQLIGAVEACHEQGIYHRDIKPENILCSADRTQVYLADFGLSTKSINSTNFRAGSFSYMSPECIRVDMVQEAYSSPSNDVWSLGVILTSLISGRNPWKYAISSDECYKAFARNPNFLRNMLPISAAANNILLQIFTKSERSRLTLKELKHMVLDIDTFFMTSEEIIFSTPQVQTVAHSYFGKQCGSSRYFYEETHTTSYGMMVVDGCYEQQPSHKRLRTTDWCQVPVESQEPSYSAEQEISPHQSSENVDMESPSGYLSQHRDGRLKWGTALLKDGKLEESPYDGLDDYSSALPGSMTGPPPRVFSPVGIFKRIFDRIL
ncbi:Aurora kinase [Abortiporus biennis]